MAIFTAIGAGIFGAGTLMAGISAAALQVAAGIALNYFFAGPNGQSEQQYAGMQGQLQVGADVARTVPFGLGLAEHSLVYANYWGQDGKTPNAYLTQVFCLGDYPVKALAELYVDGTLETPLWGEAGEMGAPLAGKRRGGGDHAWVKFYDGTQLTADPWLVSQFGSHPERPYSSTRVGYGCPYLILTTKVNEELWNGWPAIKAVLSGARLYDISKDSTRGGVGPQRIGLPNTWGGDGDDLTAVQAYALFMGVRFNGQWLYGLQNLPVAQLPDAWWVAQVNACRATVTGPDGPEPTYRSGGSLQVSRPISDAVTALVTSCQGSIVEVGGEYRLHVGAAKAPVYHITDADVFSTEPRRFTPFFGLAETVNGIAATHPSPENGWNVLPLPTLLRPDLETKDGNRRLLASVDLELVPYEWQAQRIMASALEEARRERKLTLALPGAFYLALPGEWIIFTSPANGFVDKVFRIDGIVDRDDGHVLWDITEIEPGDYDPDFSTYVPPVSGSLLPGYVPAQTIVAWAVTPDSIKDDQGRPRRPAVRFHWDPEIENVRSVGFQLRTASDHDLVLDESFDNVALGSIALASARIMPLQSLEGRGRYYSTSGTVPQDWTGWLPVTTDDIKLGPLDVVYGDLDLDELGEQFDGLLKWIGSNVRDLIQQAQAQATLTGDQELANATQFDELRRSLSTVAGNLSASFEETITTAIIPMNGQLVALADALTELSAADGDQVNTARWRMTTMSGPVGYSQIGMEARFDTGDEGDFRTAGMFILTPNDPLDPTQMLFDAERFVFGDLSSGSIVNPLVYDTGIWRVNNLLVGTASIRDAAIVAAKIGDAQITTAKIATAAITTAKIANLAVTSAEIATAAITNTKIGTAAITSAKIADLEVERIKIANGAVTDFVTLVTTGGGTTSPTSVDGPTFIATDGPWMEFAGVSTTRSATGTITVELRLVNVTTGVVQTVASGVDGMNHGSTRMGTPGQTYRYRMFFSPNWATTGTYTFSITQGASILRK